MQNEKPILILLIPGFPASETDSTCLPAQQSLVRCIRDSYPQVEIMVLTFEYPYHKKEYDWNGIKVIPFGGRNKGGLRRFLLRRNVNSTLKKIYRNRKITGILSCWYGECALAGKKFADKHGIKHFCWISGQDAKKENKFPGRARLRENELIAMSDFIRGFFEKNHGISPDHVIPPGIDQKEFLSPAPTKDIDLMAGGSLIPLKRFEIFIHVVAEIKKQFPSLKAILVGEGPERKKLELMIYSKGLSSNITMTGELPHAELLRMAQRSKIFLHPSSYEAFGVVILEALAAGASVCSFVKPMISSINNWHIVKSKEEMIAKTISIMEDPPKEYSAQIPYPVNDTASRIMNLFSSQ